MANQQTVPIHFQQIFSGKQYITTNAAKLAMKRKNVVLAINNYIAGRMDEYGELVLQKVRTLSSKRYASLKDLHYMGHPYAKRHYGGKFKKGMAIMPAPAYILNRQSSELFRGWRRTKGFVNQRHNAAEVKLFNRKKHSAAIIRGGPKSKMIRRPIVDTAVKLVRSSTIPMSKKISQFVHNTLANLKTT